MSDGFDKEAEREKLREKFAEDEKKREHTQQMSELLLKGATMTNRHCEECGDPIFRYDGREFCPTCGNEAGGAAEARDAPADEGEAPTEGSGDSTEAGDAPAVETATSADADAEESADAAAENGAVDSGANGPVRSQSPPSTAAPQGSTPPREPAPRVSESRRSEPPQSPASRSSDDAESVGAARASLTRTLTRFARAAEETDDPRRARDHLEAAREAAEALAALNR